MIWQKLKYLQQNKITNVFVDFRQPSADYGEIRGAMMNGVMAVAQPKKVLTSPFSQTMEQIAPTWPPFYRESQKYMVLGKTLS